MKKLLPLLLILGACQTAYAETSVWKAEKDGATVFLGGTIHLLRPQDFPLPKEFDQAYSESKVIALETDISQLSQPQMVQKMLAILSYDDKRTLQSEVSAATYKTLETYAQSFGISLQRLERARPGLILSTFLGLELQKLGVTQQGVDTHFLNQARQDGKRANYLETPEAQLQFLAQIGIGNEDDFYQKMLQDFKQTQSQFEAMLTHWRSGDSKKLDSLINLMMKKESPATYQSLIVTRNRNWMPAIEAYFNSPEIEFVLVGAAHLIGEDGIITQLKNKGYRVNKL